MKTYRLFAALAVLAVPALLHAQLDTVWLRQYDAGNADEDLFSDMYVDSAGNVYACGTGYTSTTSMWDILVRKYGPNGESLWAAVYDGPWHHDDSAAAIAVDQAGNVYVCGWTSDSTFAFDMVTLKYTAAGALAWARSFSRGTGDNAASAIGLDRAGHVVVTGYCGDTLPGNIDYCTISYNAATGDTAWVRFYNRTPEYDEDVAVSLCVDDSGNVYVTGFSYDDGTDYDFVTLRYTPAGAQTWYKRYNKRPWSYDDYGTKVVFDPVTRSVVVGGTVYDDNQDYNYFTIKYRSRNGDSLWAREYNRYPANDEDMLVSVATDRYGNVYVTGTSADLTSGYDMATVKYDVNSSQRWVARYDQALDDDAGIDLVVDSLGNTLVIGYGAAFATDLDLALVKLDSTGAQKWAYVWDHPTSHNEDVGCRVAVRRDGRYIVGGTAFDNASDYDLLTMKLREVGHDFGAAFLGMPESLWVTDTLRPVAVVRNLAVSSDSCWVRLTLRPGAYRDSAWVALGVNGADTVRFRGWVPDSACVVTATAWTSLAVDERRDNDTALADVTVWDDTTGVAERRDGRPGFALAVMPNPVRQTGILRYAGIPGQRATFSLYDVSGALVWSKAEAARASGAAGERVVRLDASRLASGVYFLKLRQGEQESSRKLVVQR